MECWNRQVHCICARRNDCKSDSAYREISDVVGISHRSFCKCRRVKHVICINHVVCSEIGGRNFFFLECSKDYMMPTNTVSAYLSMISNLLGRSRWPHSIRKWFPTSGRDPIQVGVGSDVVSREGFKKKSIIMKKKKNSI
jgi:hypothetical protein